MVASKREEMDREIDHLLITQSENLRRYWEVSRCTPWEKATWLLQQQWVTIRDSEICPGLGAVWLPLLREAANILLCSYSHATDMQPRVMQLTCSRQSKPESEVNVECGCA